MINIREGMWAFFSSKNASEVTSWWVDSEPEPVLIDCPVVDSSFISKLNELTGKRSPKIILTSRESHSNFKKLREFYDWNVLVQEQEAYLLPGVERLETFSEEYLTDSGLKVLWTPGVTPGSCVVYAPSPWNVLFCGRLLIPVASNRLAAFRTKNTFHWSMQQNSLKKMRDWIPSDAFPGVASGVLSNHLSDEKLLPWDAWDMHD